MISKDDGGEPTLESEIEPVVEFVSHICRWAECVAKAKRQIPIPNPGIGSQSRETFWQLSKGRFVCTPRPPRFRRRNRRKECRPS